MLSSYEEYQAMYEAEEILWWYKILHGKILKEIQQEFSEDKQIVILDAGCGTGGLMSFLIKNGYENIQGFDFSDDAVKFCNERKLAVQKIDITNFNKEFENDHFDLIINNDVVYQFEDEVIKKAIDNLQKKLKPQGLLISNNNAFNIFYGTHDIAVGGKQRFTLYNFKDILQGTTLKIVSHSYWSLLLSPLILIVRLSQQLQLKFKLINLSTIKSDVNIPSNFINNFLYQIVKLEGRIFKRGFFGSSLFLVIKKK